MQSCSSRAVSLGWRKPRPYFHRLSLVPHYPPLLHDNARPPGAVPGCCLAIRPLSDCVLLGQRMQDQGSSSCAAVVSIAIRQVVAWSNFLVPPWQGMHECKERCPETFGRNFPGAPRGVTGGQSCRRACTHVGCVIVLTAQLAQDSWQGQITPQITRHCPCSVCSRGNEAAGGWVERWSR